MKNDNNIDATRLFHDLKVDPVPLSQDYSPDKFGRELLQGNHEQPYTISYSATSYVSPSENKYC